METRNTIEDDTEQTKSDTSSTQSIIDNFHLASNEKQNLLLNR